MSEMSKCDNDLFQLMAQAKFVLSGTTDAAVKVQFFYCLQEFFDNSNAWVEAIGFTVVPNLLDYQLDPISGRILRLLDTVDQNNVPQAATMPLPGTIHFLYPYSNPQPMTALVAKNVTDPLESFPPDFPDWILPQYGLGLLSGVLGNFMGQPGQSWSDRATATYHLVRFRDAMMHARVATKYQNKVGAQAWAYPGQFRTTTQRGGVSTFNVSPPPTPLR
jgi:hypothetical protein